MVLLFDPAAAEENFIFTSQHVISRVRRILLVSLILTPGVKIASNEEYRMKNIDKTMDSGSEPGMTPPADGADK